MFVKIADKRIYKGNQVSLPKIFIQDNNLEPGDLLDVYRSTGNGCDMITIVKSGTNINEIISKNLLKNTNDILNNQNNS